MAVSINDIKKEVNIYDETVSFEVEFGDEKTEEVKYYPYFKPSKISELIEDLTGFYQKAKVEKVRIPNEEFPQIVMYFIMRHFTDLKFGKLNKASSFYREFNAVINSSLFKFLSEEAFLESSVRGVFERINDVVLNNDKMVALQSVISDMNKEVKSKYEKK